MSVSESHPSSDEPCASRDEEYLLTESEGQIAAALALMTGFSQGCCAVHRSPMAQRVAKQLAQMAHNAVNTPDMRDFLQRLAQRWASVGRSLQAQDRDADPYPEPDVSSHHLNAHTPSPATPHVRWPATPETLQ